MTKSITIAEIAEWLNTLGLALKPVHGHHGTWIATVVDQKNPQDVVATATGANYAEAVLNVIAKVAKRDGSGN